jgi:CDP-diacylglycerol--serine O-phosphatidyltransferase
MSDESRLSRSLVKRLEARNGWGSASDRTNILWTLNGADALSLAALFVAWSSALLFMAGEPNWAIVVMFGAFVFDKLDGYWARRQGISSKFGRQIDSFIDIFAYLVTGALLFHYELAPNRLASAVVGFAILALGGLRLVRHNAEGFESEDDVSYYHGTTVVHTNAVVVLNYVLLSLVGVWNGWIAAATVLLAAPLMISEYRAPKTYAAHVLLGGFAGGVVALTLLIEYGYLG